ncbi:hypothetical protein DL766_003893 [Monosporascus sp. MC13-8B]|uniref:Mob1/phocein n=1 Tax=Monosporascus cannonballus TaxID=155416 RepID=A0ABY0HJQ4_9PEZI|nr:hypothetical protein DL762_001414 [Monosporascus cannonballus]RYP00973.1 hypothetical protein DL763_000394 [Monosporascus cannonballus]RYP32568.1 hypothetical protein DL766_003893 [Monosporascus sp. MC13-8B]
MSSPRLPSPPPPAEIQIGPKSPGLGSTASLEQQEMEQTITDANAKRRIRPGTKAEDMAAGPPLVPLSELDSAFQLQEHLAALHYYHTSSNTTPITRTAATHLAAPPPGIDRTLWLYELCRFLISQCNTLIVGFLFDSPPCSAATCPEMRASEWQFLCAVHDQPKSCCAIDYCCHTLDWAANVVTNPKLFPSRFVVSEGHDKSAVLKNLVNVFRRLHRIFAHAWFQHRGVFWRTEGQTGLYVFFKTVCDMYDLLPAENYKLPPEAEGLDSAPSEKEEKRPVVTAIAKPPSQQNESGEHEDDRHGLNTRRSSNTARHSSRPSTGRAVTTVIEEREDENSDVANKLKAMHISPPEPVEEESEVEVPVIVEGEIADNPAAAPQAPGQQDETQSYDVKIDVQGDVSVEPDTVEEGDYAGGEAPPVFEHEKVGSPSDAAEPKSDAHKPAGDAEGRESQNQAPTSSADPAAEEPENPPPPPPPPAESTDGTAEQKPPAAGEEEAASSEKASTG